MKIKLKSLKGKANIHQTHKKDWSILLPIMVIIVIGKVVPVLT
jgi:hypothetical protein